MQQHERGDPIQELGLMEWAGSIRGSSELQGPARRREFLDGHVAQCDLDRPLWKQAFERFEAGYAATTGLGLSFVSGLIILIFVFLRRRGWEV
jgi:hypothetical protein